MPAEVLKLRMPPHSVEAEQVFDARVWPRVARMLKVEDFFRRDHQRSFETIAASAGLGRHST